jgi:hypothetical protein
MRLNAYGQRLKSGRGYTDGRCVVNDITPEQVEKHPRIYADHIKFLHTEMQELRGTLEVTQRELKRLMALYEQLST